MAIPIPPAHDLPDHRDMPGVPGSGAPEVPDEREPGGPAPVPPDWQPPDPEEPPQPER